MICPFIVGERIYLTALCVEDAEKTIELYSDPEVRKYSGHGSPHNFAAEREYIRKVNEEDPPYFAIRLKADDRLIGDINLYIKEMQIDRKAELAAIIGDKTLWGRGIGTEAVKLVLDYGFGTLNLNRIFIKTVADNLQALRCGEKAGFKYEGILRQDYFSEGVFLDHIIMSILRGEWLQDNPANSQ